MIAVDSNLLIYSHREDCRFHALAKELVDSLRHQPAPWAIPWPCVHEFIAKMTGIRPTKASATLVFTA